MAVAHHRSARVIALVIVIAFSKIAPNNAVNGGFLRENGKNESGAHADGLFGHLRQFYRFPERQFTAAQKAENPASDFRGDFFRLLQHFLVFGLLSLGDFQQIVLFRLRGVYRFLLAVVVFFQSESVGTFQ